MVLLYNVQKISTTTFLTTSFDTILINAVDPTVNIILPPITQEGQYYKIKRIDASTNLVFILGTDSDTISYANSQYIDNDQVFELISIIDSSNPNLKNWELVLNTNP